MRLVNSFDSEVEFNDLEKAKEYYIPSKELDEDMRNKETYIGENFEEYIEKWSKYVSDIKESENLEELCDVLNRNSDEFDNGSRWNVID